MADTIINNPGGASQQPAASTGGDNGGGFSSGVVVTVLVIVLVLFLAFFVFGRGWGGDKGGEMERDISPQPTTNSGGTNINVPEKLEIDINKK